MSFRWTGWDGGGGGGMGVGWLSGGTRHSREGGVARLEGSNGVIMGSATVSKFVTVSYSLTPFPLLFFALLIVGFSLLFQIYNLIGFPSIRRSKPLKRSHVIKYPAADIFLLVGLAF